MAWIFWFAVCFHAVHVLRVLFHGVFFMSMVWTGASGVQHRRETQQCRVFFFKCLSSYNENELHSVNVWWNHKYKVTCECCRHGFGCSPNLYLMLSWTDASGFEHRNETTALFTLFSWYFTWLCSYRRELSWVEDEKIILFVSLFSSACYMMSLFRIDASSATDRCMARHCVYVFFVRYYLMLCFDQIRVDLDIKARQPRTFVWFFFFMVPSVFCWTDASGVEHRSKTTPHSLRSHQHGRL